MWQISILSARTKEKYNLYFQFGKCSMVIEIFIYTMTYHAL